MYLKISYVYNRKKMFYIFMNSDNFSRLYLLFTQYFAIIFFIMHFSSNIRCFHVCYAEFNFIKIF